jgi:hypothetical protein
VGDLLRERLSSYTLADMVLRASGTAIPAK